MVEHPNLKLALKKQQKKPKKKLLSRMGNTLGHMDKCTLKVLEGVGQVAEGDL